MLLYEFILLLSLLISFCNGVTYRDIYKDAEEVRKASLGACQLKLLKLKKRIEHSLEFANKIISYYIEDAVKAGVRSFSVQSRVIRVKANQFYECPWNNDNTACCLNSADPIPKTAGPKGRVFHRIGATLHVGHILSDKLCTSECLWVGEDCAKASQQKLTGYMADSDERKKLTEDMRFQSLFNETSVDSASSLMSTVEGLAFLATNLIAAGYNATINEDFMYLNIDLWRRYPKPLLTVPAVSRDLSEPGVVAYLEFMSKYVPCKVQRRRRKRM